MKKIWPRRPGNRSWQKPHPSSKVLRRRHEQTGREAVKRWLPKLEQDLALRRARVVSGDFARIGRAERRRARRQHGLSARQWKKWVRFVAEKVGARQPGIQPQ